MMYGRKKHLLDSYNAAAASASSSIGDTPPHHHSDMSSHQALNLNQSLTEQLTQQHRRGHADGGSRRTPDAAPAPPRVEAAPRVDDVVGGGRPSSPARGGPSRRPAAVDEPPPPQPPKPGSAAAARPPPRSPDMAFAAAAAAAAAGMDPLTARLALQHQLGLFPPQHPALHPPPPSFLLPPASDSGITQHLELLYRVKYPGYPVPPPWLLYQYQDELVRDAALLQHQQQQQQHQANSDHRERADNAAKDRHCLLYTSPSPRDRQKSRMPSSA